MKKSNSVKPESGDSKKQAEKNGEEKANSEIYKTEIFQLQLGKELPAREMTARNFSGQFHKVKWDQIIQMANVISDLAAQFLSIDKSTIILDDSFGFDENKARVGRQGVVQEKIGIELVSELNVAIKHFMQQVTEIRDPKTRADLLKQDPISADTQILVKKIATEFLINNGNVKILIPIEHHFGGEKIVCSGRYAEKPPAKIQDQTTLIVVGNLNSIMKKQRRCVVKIKDGGSVNIQFDFQKHLARLAEILIMEDNFYFHALEEQDASGGQFLTLERIGDSENPTLF